MKSFRKPLEGICFFLAVLSLCSCATMADYDFSSINSSVARNDFEAVHAELEKNDSGLYTKHDIVLQSIDAGLVSHYAGTFEQSNKELTLAEQKIDEYYATSISQSISSFLINDTLKDYSGETYENIYTNIFMALNYLQMNKFDDAFVEIRRFDNKLKEITSQSQLLIENTKREMEEGSDQVPAVNLKFHNSAFARYLSMLMYRSDGDSDNAAVDYKMIKDAFALQPEIYPFAIPQTVSDDVNIPSGMARLNIVSFEGRSPVKVEDVLRVPIANTYYKLALPEMKKTPSKIAGAKVLITSKADGSEQTISLEKIESIENIALDTYQQQYAMIFAKSLARSVAKAATTSVLDNQSQKQDGYAGLALSLLSLASAVTTEATERADVRTSRFFPATVSVTGVTLSPGLYDIRIVYYNAHGTPVAERLFTDFRIDSGKLNLAESVCLQ